MPIARYKHIPFFSANNKKLSLSIFTPYKFFSSISKSAIKGNNL